MFGKVLVHSTRQYHWVMCAYVLFSSENIFSISSMHHKAVSIISQKWYTVSKNQECQLSGLCWNPSTVLIVVSGMETFWLFSGVHGLSVVCSPTLIFLSEFGLMRRKQGDCFGRCFQAWLLVYLYILYVYVYLCVHWLYNFCILLVCRFYFIVFYLFIYFSTCLYCLVGCLSMIVWTHAVSGVLYAFVLYFCICTCSAQLSMFYMEICSRNTIIILLSLWSRAFL